MLFLNLSPFVFVTCLTVLFFAGTVKGTLGMGLPLFAVPALVSVFDLPTAIALMMVPILVSNFLQVWRGKKKSESIKSLKRFFPLILTLIPFTVLTAQYISKIDIKMGSIIMGMIVILFSLSQLLTTKFYISPKIEVFFSPLIGILAGILGGISSLIGPMIAMYLVSLKLQKDLFVITIAIIFLFFSSTLYITLIFSGTMNFTNITSSFLASIPVMIGVVFGGKIRKKINQKKFEIFLIFFLILIGLNLLRRGFFG